MNAWMLSSGEAISILNNVPDELSESLAIVSRWCLAMLTLTTKLTVKGSKEWIALL